MAYQELDIGAAGRVLMYRLRYHQRRTGTTLAQLSKAVGGLGHPLSPQRIGQVLNGVRRLATDDLTALATALDIPASSLILDQSPGAQSMLVADARDLRDSELATRLDQARLERDGSETQLYQSLTPHREAYEVDLPEVILGRLEALSMRIEVREIEKERREAAKRQAEAKAAVDEENEAIDNLVISGAMGDMPGDRTYEAHKARAEKRAARKGTTDGKR